jgi:hypothetical protein
MSKRITLVAALAIASVRCEPAVPAGTAPASVVTAVFDPTHTQIPLPNDLILAMDPSTLDVSAAQAELLGVFIEKKGFPSDQEVPLTVDFAENDIDPTTGKVTSVAPKLDFTSFTSSTAFVWGIRPEGQGEIALDPITAADYSDKGAFGELMIHRKGRQPWPSGQYVLLIRGGTNGIHTSDNAPVHPAQIFYLVLQGKDLTTEQNLGLLAAQLGGYEAARQAAIQLNALAGLYKATVFPVADRRFPHEELAIASTFAIAPRKTQVELDPGRGLLPLPIDLLRDQKPGGTLTPLAACTLANGKLDAQGACLDADGHPSAAAQGFASLDGFSTTAAILAPTSELVSVETITPDSVKLYEIPPSGAPVLVDPRTYITEPCEVTSSCTSSIAFSPAIVLQPAGATANDKTSAFRTRPLKDDADYGVIITTDVADKTGRPIVAGTAARILLLDNPVSIDGHSALQGVDDATAAGLEAMRKRVGPLVTMSAIEKSKIAMAYTFRTQAFSARSTALAQLPYAEPAATAMPGAVTATSARTAFEKYGLDARYAPFAHIDEILETSITTFNLLDPATGAFNPTAPLAETIDVLISVPKAASTATCAGALAPLRCAPMVVFRHGLSGGRADMLAIADGFAEQGLATVAIDAAKHGDRSYCKADTECAVGKCVHDPALSHQGDPEGATPGRCMDGGSPGKFVKRPVDCPAQGGCPRPPSDGIPVASSNFLISANFFRTRDTLRQDIIDQSQLVRALAFAPTGAPPTGHSVYDHLATRGVIIDPERVYFFGQSLGSVQGAADVAASSRIAKAVFNVGGATAVDVITSSPAFDDSVNRLLITLGIERGTARYLQFLVLAKTIVDPAEPANYLGRLAPKKVLTQVAYCDQVVPNPFGYLFSAVAGTGPLPAPGFEAGTGTFELFVAASTDFTDCPIFGGKPLPPSAVSHAFATHWDAPSDETGMRAHAITVSAQRDAARFLASDVIPHSVQGPAQ